MSTVAFSIQDAAVRILGPFRDFGSPTDFGGHLLCISGTTYGIIQVVLTGTDCNTSIFGTFLVSVDGGGFTTIGANNGSVNTVALFSGLTDTAHTVILRCPAGHYIDQTADDATHCSFALTGAAPAISAVSGFDHIVTLPSAGVTIGGGWVARDFGGIGAGNPFQGTFPWPTIDFYAKISSFGAYFDQRGKFGYAIDGVDQGPFTVVSGNGNPDYEWASIVSGLDATTEHLYSLKGQAAIYQITTVGGTGINTSSNPPIKPGLYAYGDSITAGTLGGLASVLQVYAYQLGLSIRYSTCFDGNPGANVSTSLRDATGQMTSASAAPAVLLILGGTNDLAGGIDIPTFTADYTTMLNNITSVWTTTKIKCLGILPRTSFSQAQIDVYNAAIVAAIAAATPNTNIAYVDTKSWNMGGAAYTSGGSLDVTNFSADHVHPNDVGNLFMRDKLLGLFANSLIAKPIVARVDWLKYAD